MDELTRYHYLQALGIPLWYEKPQVLVGHKEEPRELHTKDSGRKHGEGSKGELSQTIAQSIAQTITQVRGEDQSQIVAEEKQINNHSFALKDDQLAKKLKEEISFKEKGQATYEAIDYQNFIAEEDGHPFLSYWTARNPIQDLQTQRETLVTSQYEEDIKTFYQEQGEGPQNLKFLYGHLPKTAEILIITDPPLPTEYLVGQHFSEKIRPLFYALFASIGFTQDAIAFTSFIKTESPWYKHHPKIFTHELPHHLNLLIAEIELIQPKALIFMGREVVQTLLFPHKPFKKLQETLETITINEKDYPLILLPRPELIYQNIRLKRECWQQLKKLKRTLQ